MPYTPQKYEFARKLINAKHHMLFVGMSGSGKSVLENGVLYTMLEESPYENMMVLIDTKQVELSGFQYAPHCAKYVNDYTEIPFVLKKVVEIMDARFKRMATQGLKKTNEPTLWIVIDELFDLFTLCRANKREIMAYLDRISSQGRAAGVLLLACTQICTKAVLGSSIVCNIPNKVCLHVECSQDSRNVLRHNGAETLPDYGKGILKMNSHEETIDIPLTKEEYIHDRVDSWNQVDWKARYGNRQ